MNPPTIRLGPLEETLVKPTPTQVVACSVNAKDDQDCNLTKQCAILGLCWPRSSWPAGIRPDPWKLGRSILDYGSAVFDSLVGAGIQPARVWKAAQEAYLYAATTMPADEEVKANEDFSEAPTGG